MSSTTIHPFDILLPDFILDALESCGITADGSITALNSYENRVYQVGMEEGAPLIAKFYRPHRWSDAQIKEEHQFCQALEAHELSVLTPLTSEALAKLNGAAAPLSRSHAPDETLFEYKGMRFSLYPRKGGRAPELTDLETLKQLSRMVARIHAIGATEPFQSRPQLDIHSYGEASVALISEQFIPDELKTSYDTLTQDLLQRVKQRFDQVGDVQWIRTHSDCHIGNILSRDDELLFLDFDDARMAPAIQDLWMLLSGDREQRAVQIGVIVDAYRAFYDFDPKELILIEALQALRILNYSAWLARRWSDPAFPHNFPWFNTMRFWSDHILTLREQLADLMEPPLVLEQNFNR